MARKRNNRGLPSVNPAAAVAPVLAGNNMLMGGDGGATGGLVDPIYEGLFGGNTDEEDANAYEALQNAQGVFKGLTPPDLKPVDLDEYEWLGDYKPPATVQSSHIDAGKDVTYEGVDPRLAELERVGDSAFNDIEGDPRLKDHQMGALEALDEIVAGGGMTAADEANLNKILSGTAQADRGRREAILQNQQARGMGGSGNELLALLDSSQAATDRANQSGLDVAGMAEARALDAISRGGDLAGNIRGQDFGEAAAVAQANDEIARFNAANSNQMSQWNAGAVNNMGQFNAGNTLQTSMYNKDNELGVAKFNAGNDMTANLANTGYTNNAAQYSHQGRQGVHDSNTGVANNQTMHNGYTLPQTQWGNTIDVAKGVAGAYGMEQDYWNRQGDRETAEAAGRAGLAGQLGAAGVAASDERVKKNVSKISDDELDEFLGAIEPKRYDYKDPSAPGQEGGKQLGFMLQDVQGTKVGKDITRKGDDGKLYYDKKNLDGVILAAVASLAKGRKAA